MKKQIILSLVVVFALAVFAPTVVKAMDNSSKIVMVEGEEKKAETKKADEKKADCTATKKECTATKSTCAEKKTDCCATKKAECTDKKTEKK